MKSQNKLNCELVELELNAWSMWQEWNELYHKTNLSSQKDYASQDTFRKFLLKSFWIKIE